MHDDEVTAIKRSKGRITAVTARRGLGIRLHPGIPNNRQLDYRVALCVQRRFVLQAAPAARKSPKSAMASFSSWTRPFASRCCVRTADLKVVATCGAVRVRHGRPSSSQSAPRAFKARCAHRGLPAQLLGSLGMTQSNIFCCCVTSGNSSVMAASTGAKSSQIGHGNPNSSVCPQGHRCRHQPAPGDGRVTR
jgi:hypothetical protein